eukprot:3833629-Amphidinium_carterae.1
MPVANFWDHLRICIYIPKPAEICTSPSLTQVRIYIYIALEQVRILHLQQVRIYIYIGLEQ